MDPDEITQCGKSAAKEKIMKIFTIRCRLTLGLLAALSFSLCLQQPAFCQTEKLGLVKYTPPKGWTKILPKGKTTAQENLVQFSHVNEATGKFCVITLYGATTGKGDPDKDFDSEWNNFAVKPFKAAANAPRVPVLSVEGWTLISGAGEVEVKGRTTKILLTVFSGFGKAFSVLVLTDDRSYKPQVQAFIESFVLDKPAP